jgi:hypothetical protein
MTMSWPQPQPEAVEAALAWLRAQDPRHSLDALARQLRDAGYGSLEVDAAIARRQAELDAALPPGTDKRRLAATVLLVAFVGGWAAVTLLLVAGGPYTYMMKGTEGIASLILAALLLPALLLGLAAVRLSGRLRRGVEGAMAWVLVLPVIYLVVLGGTCVAMYQSA